MDESITWDELMEYMRIERNRILSAAEVAKRVGPVTHLIVMPNQAVYVNRNFGACPDEQIVDQQLAASILFHGPSLTLQRKQGCKQGVSYIFNNR